MKRKKEIEEEIKKVSLKNNINQEKEEYEVKVKDLQTKIESEQKGRIRIEKVYVKAYLFQEYRQTILKEECESGSLPLKVIGHVESCYVDCQGTPRQPGLVPLSRGKIIIDPAISPTAFEGLEEYSHIWVIFYFHLNSNTPTLKKCNNEKGFTFPAKVKAPRLQGDKTGLFSTRSPHRPNPVGLSVVKLDKIYIKGNVKILYISNMDLVNESPIFDIKPYLPHLESISTSCTPEWVVANTPKRVVIFSEKSINDLKEVSGKMKFYENYDEAFAVINQVLASDVSNRPSHLLCKLHFDNLVIEFKCQDNNVNVENILLVQLYFFC